MTYSLGARTTAIAAGTLSTALILGSLPAVAQEKIDLTPTFDFYTNELAKNDGKLIGFDGKPHNVNTLDGLFAYLAVAETPEQKEIVKKAYDTFKPNFDEIIYAFDEIDAGRLAKVVALQAAFDDVNPNYVEDLKKTQQDNGGVLSLNAEGQPSPNSVNNFGNSLAAIAFARAGEKDAAEKVLDFLDTQKCADGSFGWQPAPCASGDTDTTSMVAMAAFAVNGKDDEDLAGAVAYLKGKINEEGGIDGGWGANTNSTGLAASAFALAGDADSLAKTQGYLAKAVFPVDVSDGLAGAIAYKPADVAAATKVNNQIIMATNQAAIGLAGKSFADVSVKVPAPEQPKPDPTPQDLGAKDNTVLYAVLGVLGAIAAIGGIIIALVQQGILTLPAQLQQLLKF